MFAGDWSGPCDCFGSGGDSHTAGTLTPVATGCTATGLMSGHIVYLKPEHLMKI